MHNPPLMASAGRPNSFCQSVLAAEGCVSLMERLWPALEVIDTSSGALGGAVRRTLDELIPILILAPADVTTRSARLERLFQAVIDDGVQYLAPVEDRWGEIAVYPELMVEYAERLRALIRRVWVDEATGYMLKAPVVRTDSSLTPRRKPPTPPGALRNKLPFRDLSVRRYPPVSSPICSGIVREEALCQTLSV